MSDVQSTKPLVELTNCRFRLIPGQNNISNRLSSFSHVAAGIGCVGQITADPSAFSSAPAGDAGFAPPTAARAGVPRAPLTSAVQFCPLQNLLLPRGEPKGIR